MVADYSSYVCSVGRQGRSMPNASRYRNSKALSA